MNRMFHARSEHIQITSSVMGPFSHFFTQKTHYFLERTRQNLTHRMRDATHWREVRAIRCQHWPLELQYIIFEIFQNMWHVSMICLIGFEVCFKTNTPLTYMKYCLFSYHLHLDSWEVRNPFEILIYLNPCLHGGIWHLALSSHQTVYDGPNVTKVALTGS